MIRLVFLITIIIRFSLTTPLEPSFEPNQCNERSHSSSWCESQPPRLRPETVREAHKPYVSHARTPGSFFFPFCGGEVIVFTISQEMMVDRLITCPTGKYWVSCKSSSYFPCSLERGRRYLTVAQWAPISANQLKLDNASLDIVPIMMAYKTGQQSSVTDSIAPYPARTTVAEFVGCAPTWMNLLVLWILMNIEAPGKHYAFNLQCHDDKQFYHLKPWPKQQA